MIEGERVEGDIKGIVLGKNAECFGKKNVKFTI